MRLAFSLVHTLFPSAALRTVCCDLDPKCNDVFLQQHGPKESEPDALLVFSVNELHRKLLEVDTRLVGLQFAEIE